MVPRPDNLRDRSEMPADPLSDILDLLDARCVLGGGMIAGGKWIRRFAQPNAVKVLALVEGQCWLVLEGVPAPVWIETGDVIVVNGKHALTLVSDLDMLAETENSPSIRTVNDITQLGESREFFMLGGHVGVDPVRQSLLLDVLPPLIHIRATSDEAPIMRWLLDRLAREWQAGRPGSAVASAQLAQLIFVQALRAHLDAAGPTAYGWLNGLGDERIAPALGLIHADPAKAWTLGELARAIGMSRTSFALRFKKVVGVAPLAYLTQWRMHLAERDLARSDDPVSGIAYRLGYTSESAFSNAFKRVTGSAPRSYRQQHPRSDEDAPQPAPF
jgi:AraC-like DNA-binding protein